MEIEKESTPNPHEQEVEFEFTYTDGKPFLRVLDTTIKRVSLNPITELRPIHSELMVTAADTLNEPVPATMKLGLVITFQQLQYPYSANNLFFSLSQFRILSKYAGP